MVIMAVLVTIIVALTLSAKMADIGLDAQRLTDYTLERESNYLVARSAVEMGLELLRQDTGDTDSLKDPWALGEIDLEWEGRSVSVRVVDEESKFPLSRLQKDPDGNDALGEALVRFFQLAGLRTGKEARDQFLDWVDNDMLRRSNGAESGDYPDRRAKDAPMDSLYELSFLQAWQDRPFLPSPRRKGDTSGLGLGEAAGSGTGSLAGAGGASQEQVDTAASPENSRDYQLVVPGQQTVGLGTTSDWEDWMSVSSSGKLNVNTAPKEILLCLDEAMTDVLVSEIDAKRRENAFDTVDELRNVTGMDNDLLFRIQDYLTVKSSIFEVRAVVKEYPGRVTLKALVDRSNGSNSIIRWEIQ